MQASVNKDEMLEQVRVNLLRYIERNKYNKDLVTVAFDTGYSYSSIIQFARGDRLTIPVAIALIHAYPALGDGLACPSCGRLPI